MVPVTETSLDSPLALKFGKQGPEVPLALAGLGGFCKWEGPVSGPWASDELQSIVSIVGPSQTWTTWTEVLLEDPCPLGLPDNIDRSSYHQQHHSLTALVYHASYKYNE